MIDATATYPVPNVAAARALGRVLRSLGYTENGVYRLLGDDAYSTESHDAPIAARRLPDSRLGTALQALFLQLPVARTDAVRSLGLRGVEALEDLGLADVGSTVTLRSRILPIGKLLLASDGFSRDADDPPDYVATYTPTARVLDSLTPRRQVERALDVGTGSGVHALLAAEHARTVVATDVNERALAYTELNAALSGLSNVECRRGSLFDPVAGETFDHITCNAPYVISPERRWAYRDSGFRGDEVSERVVRISAEHLRDDGFATVQVSWLAPDEDTADERVLTWTEATACDAWVLPTMSVDVLDHAAEWNEHLAPDPDALDRALDEWMSYFDELGMRWVSEGVVILRCCSNGPPAVRVDPVDDEDLDDASDQVLRAFDAKRRLRERAGDEVLDTRVAPATSLRLEEELEPDDGRHDVVGARVVLAEGTKHTVETTSEALQVITSLDEHTPLRALVTTTAAELALSPAEARRLERETSRLVRELLEVGALELRS